MTFPERSYRHIRGVAPVVQDVARELRPAMTPAERILWHALHGKRLAGVRFRRQHPVGRFVLDFYAPQHHLVIELDGSAHVGQEEHDAERTAILEAYGYRVLRFCNEDVWNDLAGALERIQEALTPCPPLPTTGEGEPDR